MTQYSRSVARWRVLLSNAGFRIWGTFSPKLICRGVRVVALQSEGPAASCLEKVAAALDLIAAVDPVGERRVHRYLSQITVLNIGASLGWYWRNLNACFISGAHVRDAAVSDIAETILHEAVHARITRAGLHSTSTTRDRIEAMCRAEQARFRSLVSQ